MRKPKQVRELEEIFRGIDNCVVSGEGHKSSVHINGVWVAVVYHEGHKDGHALNVPIYRGCVDGESIDEYKRALKQLKEGGYKIKRETILDPHLLRIVT